MEYIIDAKNQTLGRLSTKIAILLQGKNKSAYDPSRIVKDSVIVKNAKLIKLTGNKAKTKIYQRHTGYMGHLRTAKYSEVYAKHPERILESAVRGMLPKNFLRDKRMRLLVIEK